MAAGGILEPLHQQVLYKCIVARVNRAGFSAVGSVKSIKCVISQTRFNAPHGFGIYRVGFGL